MLISSILNAIAVFPCVFCKVPQILLLLKIRNTRGISFENILMELFCHVNVFGFSFFENTLQQFLEYPVLVVQNVVLLVAIAVVSSRFLRSAFWLTVFTALFLLYGILPKHVALSIIGLNSVIGVSGKVAQINEIVSSKSSDNVSYAAFFISAVASAARLANILITGIGETVIFFNFAVSVFTNTAVMTTIYMYRSKLVKQE